MTHNIIARTESPAHSCLSISAYLPVLLNASINGIEFFEGDLALVKRKGQPGLPEHLFGAVRDKITMLSKKSRRRMFFLVATCGIDFQSMLTVTYPNIFPKNGKDVKQDLNQVLTHLKSKEKLSYFWFLEFQKRGAPHTHILLTSRPTAARRRDFARFWSRRLKKTLKLDAGQIQRVYNVHSHYRQWAPIREEKGAVKYVAKYAYKTWQKEVPADFQDVGRFWGASQDVKPQQKGTMNVTADGVRLMLDVLAHDAKAYEVIPQLLFDIPYEEPSF